jgi:hypothetical protein
MPSILSKSNTCHLLRPLLAAGIVVVTVKEMQGKTIKVVSLGRKTNLQHAKKRMIL